ncbi:MAG: CBS domain-containing protein [Methanobrevibacter sp.]|nr:CBS domain-containing protein [Methanobrevibacter sp.]
MITSVQKEILEILINLYQNSDGKSIKGEDIAKVIDKNPGTIRNQMISLRSLSLVKGVPGPRGGYKPTIEAYHTLNISFTDNEAKVPVYKDNKKLDGVSVAKIEFTSVPHPNECEAVIKILGSIKDLHLGDIVRIGPTPVNNLGIIGEIVGRDDMNDILLLDISTIRSIPNYSVYDIATLDLIYLKPGDSIKDAAYLLSSNSINGAPVITEGVAIGMVSLIDIVKALSEGKENEDVRDIMSKRLYFIDKGAMIADAVYKMYKFGVSRLIVVDSEYNPIGVVTRTDLIETITNLKNFPLLNEDDLE